VEENFFINNAFHILHHNFISHNGLKYDLLFVEKLPIIFKHNNYMSFSIDFEVDQIIQLLLLYLLFQKESLEHL